MRHRVTVSRARWIAPFLFVLVGGASLGHAQHTPREIAVTFAKHGQGKVERASNENRGFFQNATIWNLRVQALTNNIQSLSVYAERVTEERRYVAPGEGEAVREGAVSNVEYFPLTTIGVETHRTVITWSGLRVALGVGLGLSLGEPELVSTTLIGNRRYEQESASIWFGLQMTGSTRLRYTVYRNDQIDIGLVAIGRYWGFPFLGPTEHTPNDYSGPQARTYHQVGYLAGVSVGF